MSNPNIRQILPSDIGTLELLAEQFEQYLNSLTPGRKRHSPMTSEVLRREIFGADPSFSGFVATIDEQIVAYLFYQRGYITEFGCRTVEVIDLFVTEKFRGKGIGKKLMFALPEVAREIGAKVIRTSVWRKNPEAVSFYHALGASLIEDEMPVCWSECDWKQ